MSLEKLTYARIITTLRTGDLMQEENKREDILKNKKYLSKIIFSFFMVSRNFPNDELPISNTSNPNTYGTHKNQSHFVNVSFICRIETIFKILN